MADWMASYLKAGGYPDTPQNRAFLSSWQRWEGGATNNNARFNYLNTTWNAPGATSINSVGVKAYNSLAQGASAWAATLRHNSNYAGLDAGLRAGNPYTKASIPGLSTWLSGSPNSPSGAAYATRVLGTRLAKAPVSPSQGTGASGGVKTSPTALATSAAGPDAGQALRSMVASALLAQSGATASGDLMGGSDLMALALARQQLMAAHQTYGAQPQQSGGLVQSRPSVRSSTGGPFKVGDPVLGGTSIGGLHQTEGLPGFPAHDYFAPAGSSVVAPIGGRVVRLSGHDPAQGPIEGPHGPLGWSVYIQGSDGRTYYLTHMGSRNVKVGETLRPGQVIGTVADYAKYGTPSHIHMGVN